MYFVRFKNQNRPGRFDFDFAHSLEEAEKINPDKSSKSQSKEKVGAARPSTFLDLHKAIARSIRSQRGLQTIFGLIHAVGGEMSYLVHVQPKLKSNAISTRSLKDRDVFEIDPTNSDVIFRGIEESLDAWRELSRLPRLLMSGFVSQYDVFFQDLMRISFFAQPGKLKTINGALPLRELLEFETIAAASDHLIEREIDRVMLQSHKQQLEEFGKLFDVKINTADECVLAFLEICERRNLYTHNNGIVNRTYLDKCRIYGLDVSKVQAGEELPVSNAYFDAAISSVQELMIKLCQFAWRKLSPAERDAADREINQLAFQLLRDTRYNVAQKILEYGTSHTSNGDAAVRDMMRVNYANALKLGGKKGASLDILKATDWSAHDIGFRISVAAVRDDVEQVVSMMKEATRSKSKYFSDPEDAFKTWPAFQTIRGEKAFQDKFKELFGKELVFAMSHGLGKGSDNNSKQKKKRAAHKRPTST